jgi:hypothetical protein
MLSGWGGLTPSRPRVGPHLLARVTEYLGPLERDTDPQQYQCHRAQGDRHIDQRQRTGRDPPNENPDSDDDQHSAEPDQL